MHETFDWLKPSKLWARGAAAFADRELFRPSLMRFHSDDFMELFLAAAAAPAPTELAAAVLPAPEGASPRKLFQPVHGDFYLICASLCCRVPGFPDHAPARAEGEQVFFVLRRRDAAGTELAWVPEGPQRGRWQPLSGNPRELQPGEERLPLLPAASQGGRSLHYGYIPVSSADSYGAPARSLESSKGYDLRIEDARGRFSTPLERNARTNAPSILEKIRNESAAIARDVSVFLLLNLWEFFSEHMPDVATALQQGTAVPFTGEKAEERGALMRFLVEQSLSEALTLARALREVASKRAALDQLGDQGVGALGFTDDYLLSDWATSSHLTALWTKVQAALESEKPPVQLPKFTGPENATYVIRCVYEMPQCEPPHVFVSEPSEPFVMASFFDVDAPARQVRIPMPTSVSLNSLRKFKKGVTFMLSDEMMKKASRVNGLGKDAINGPLAAEEPFDLAFLCSFSIQIIFIVAFFLLLIFVVILNFVFWWLPFFRICLPIPKALLPKA
jgi:hypothetical protein